MSSERAMAAYVDEMKKVAQEVRDTCTAFIYLNSLFYWFYLHNTDENKSVYILIDVLTNHFDVKRITFWASCEVGFGLTSYVL